MRPFIGCGRCCEGREGDGRSVITGRLRCNGELLEIDVVGRNHGRRPGRTQLFTWATMVRVIYEKPMPKATLAHMYSASRQTMGPTLSWRAKFFWRQSYVFVCDCLLFDCDREAINRAPEPRAQLRAPRVPRAARAANEVFLRQFYVRLRSRFVRCCATPSAPSAPSCQRSALRCDVCACA